MGSSQGEGGGGMVGEMDCSGGGILVEAVGEDAAGSGDGW